MNFFIDVFVIVLRGFQIRKVSVVSFGLVKTMLGAAFHLLILSLQTPMYKTDENKNNGELRMLNAIGNETLEAPMYEENPNEMYPRVHIVNNPMPISSNLCEPLRNDPNVVYPLDKIPPELNASANGNSPSTSSTFFKKTLKLKMLLLFLVTFMLWMIMETLGYPHLENF